MDDDRTEWVYVNFTIKELNCISHPGVQFKSFKYALPRSEFNKKSNEKSVAKRSLSDLTGHKEKVENTLFS